MPIGVKVNVSCVSPEIDWQSDQGVLHLLPNVSWECLKLPCNQKWISVICSVSSMRNNLSNCLLF